MDEKKLDYFRKHLMGWLDDLARSGWQYRDNP